MDLRDEIEHWQRHAQRLKEENDKLRAENADLREWLARYQGSQDEPAES